jgi:hypothetical protein
MCPYVGMYVRMYVRVYTYVTLIVRPVLPLALHLEIGCTYFHVRKRMHITYRMKRKQCVPNVRIRSGRACTWLHVRMCM